MCRHIHDLNIVNCDVKQPIQLNSTQLNFLARLHFSAEELMLYPRRQRRRPHAKCLGKC